MGRPKGLPKTGGRKAGTPNHRSLDHKGLIEFYGIDIIKELIATLHGLEARDRASILVKLLEYVYPKKKSLEASIEVSGEIERSNCDLSSLTDDELRTLYALTEKVNQPSELER